MFFSLNLKRQKYKSGSLNKKHFDGCKYIRFDT